MLIDTHAHLNFPAFDKDYNPPTTLPAFGWAPREEVIKKCLKNNVRMINVGTNFETSKKAVEIAQKYEKGVYASVGLHPINLDTGLVKIKTDGLEGEHFEKEFDFEKYKELAKLPKVVAIGEIGLDYYWKPKTTKKEEIFKQKQKELFLKELELAKELNLPVIFHCRMAHDDLIETLADLDCNFYDRRNRSHIPGVMHGFVGTVEQLKEYLETGLYIGFNGIIFKKIEGINFEEIIKAAPIEKTLVETDCPYLLPSVAFAKEGLTFERNEPRFLKYIAQEIARIKNLSFEKVSEITTTNAKELFQI